MIITAQAPLAFMAGRKNATNSRVKPHEMEIETKIPFSSNLHQVKDPKPYYNPPGRPRSLFYKGAEFFFNT